MQVAAENYLVGYECCFTFGQPTKAIEGVELPMVACRSTIKDAANQLV